MSVFEKATKEKAKGRVVIIGPAGSGKDCHTHHAPPARPVNFA